MDALPQDLHAGIMRAMRTLTVLAISAFAALGLAGPVSAASYDTHLTRAPYLTDLVGLHVIVNFATDQSGTAASVSYGPFDGTTCTLPSTQSATRTTVTVGSRQRVPVEGLAHAAERRPVLLPRAARRRRPARQPATPPCSRRRRLPAPRSRSRSRSSATGDSSMRTATTRISRTCSARSPAAASASRSRPATTATRPEARRTTAICKQVGRRDGRDLRRSLLARPGRLRAALHGIRQSRAQRHGARRPHELAAGCRRLELGRPLPNDLYCCVNGTTVDQLRAAPGTPSTPGPARFYVLTSAWGDTNPGTASVYANDYAAHFAPGTPEYAWLLADLQSHPSGLKFAFSHYPFYSDDKSQGSDTFIDGPSSLEGLFAHLRREHRVQRPLARLRAQRCRARPVPRSRTSRAAAAARWSRSGRATPSMPSASAGRRRSSRERVAAARRCPTSATQVFHFIKVTVSGTTVTVAPTDELGRTFDVQTYSFANAIADTVIDSAPANPSNSRTATFSFHSTVEPATFACSLDGAARAAPCTSPVTYTGLADGSHSFSVVANGRLGHGSDAGRPHLDRSTRPHRRSRRRSSPRRSGRAPSASAGAPRATPAGVAGYDITRDGVVIGSAGATQTSYSDATAAAATTYQYAVRARDAAGNTSAYSAPAAATTPGRCRPVPERLRGRVHGLDVLGRPGARGVHRAQRRLRGRGQHDERRHLRQEDGHGGAGRLRARLLQPEERREPGQPAAHARHRQASRWATCSSRRPVSSDGATTSTATTTMSSTVVGPGWHCARAPPARQRRGEHQRRLARRDARRRHLVRH